MTKTSIRGLALITCFSALPLLAGLMGCAGERYHETTTQHVEDSRIAERVREALAAGDGYKYDGVKVGACNGVVQLTGVVNTSAQRNNAGAVANSVAGVKGVENNLSVKN